jgi:photosystem II stability/assembly factor-like uncharacterized protein
LRVHRTILAAIVTLTPLALFAGESLRRAAPVFVLAVDLQNPATIYAVAQVKTIRSSHNEGRIYRSDDGGAHWEPVTTPEFAPGDATIDQFVPSIAVDPKVAGTLYAAADAVVTFGHNFVGVGYLFKSLDGGERWSKVFDHSNDPTTIVIDPIFSANVWVGAYSAAAPVGIFKSVDSGADWLDVSPPGFDACKALGIDPVNPAIVYAGGCLTPLFRSPDGGSSWKPISSGLPSDAAPPPAFAIAPSRTSTLYAGTLHGVFRSTDSGEHWTSESAGIGDATILALTVDPRSASVAYAGTPAGLFKTLGGGASWSPSAPGLEDAAIYVVVIDPSAPDTVYLGTSLGVFKSIDAGATWSPINSGLPPVGIVPVSVEGPPAAVHGRP